MEYYMKYEYSNLQLISLDNLILSDSYRNPYY